MRLREAIEWIVQRHGHEKVGFLTLTFADNLRDWDEAERRFASFEKNVLSLYCRDWACVVQYQERGAIHYHLVCGFPVDIRTGTDIAVVKNRKLPRWMRYSKAAVSPNLRQYWQDICARASGRGKWAGGGYGMGRVELMPLEKEAGAVANYLANYLKIGVAREHRRKKKLRFSRTISCWLGREFQANTFGHWVWRKKLQLVARDFGMHRYEDLADYFGPRWFYYLRDAVRACPFTADKEDWRKGIAEKVFRRHGQEVFDRESDRGLRENDPKWNAYRSEKASVWERWQEELEQQQQTRDTDPDWFVPYWETPTEWQLQLLLMNYDPEKHQR